MANDDTTTTGAPESVLGSLPATRTERFGRARREVTVAKTQARGPRPAKAKPARAKAPAPARAKTARAKSSHKPVAVRAGCPPLERPKVATPPPRPIGAPTGTELVTTAIRATGELARIGLTVGGQVLKRAVDRLPRP